ncbi:MAG: cobalamin-binding protein [Tepidanaerobacter acetatoxydans]|uniref:ABC transporter substrate-binding protein n=1 Tax=Tepidanaerobacter acetatoxydans TaxID=499229 RepID=UPI0026ED0F11|nr:cobalamin-binding protein [Tepidanaerobacter acetatoxydans]NLU10479.1 cobalamin-binding protein [Tepidanaerobacter acetatoxydans]
MKNHFKIITKTLIIILITLCIVGCKNESKISESNPQNHKTNTAFPITLTDQMGREVTIEKLPERIISLAPSNTEILFTLGLEDRIVGVTDFCDYPEAAKSKEKIGGFSEPNIEKIISLQPDLILATSMHQKPVEELEKLNVPSVVLDPKDFEDVFTSIEIIGKATGQDDKAAAIVGDLKARVKDVDDKVIKLTEDERPKVYYEIWPSPITTAGPGTFVNDIIQRAGGENIAKDAKKAYPQYSQEMIVAKNPDIIIFSHHGSSNQSAEDILNRQGWESIEAIKNNKVFYVEENLVQRATPRLVDGLEQLAMMMHPELFK